MYVQYLNYLLCSKVLILNPNVGDIVWTSSPLNFLRIVVLPALSSPLKIKCSGWLRREE